MPTPTLPRGARFLFQKRVYEAILKFAKKRDLTPKQLAEELDVSEGGARAWLSGGSWPSFTAALRIAPKVGVEVPV